MRVQNAAELWKVLTEIFPSFASHCPVEEIESDTTFHAVMLDFTPYFGGNREQFSDKQLKSLGAFVNEAVSIDDKLENAIGTCFLEHLGQVKGYKALAPYLSAMAKSKAHA